MSLPQLTYRVTIPLQHNGDCSLLGVASDLSIYAEESYGDSWLAQSGVRLDGSLIASVDEAHGTNSDLAPLALPDDLITPQTGWHTMMLNFSGPRHRGLRGPERLPDLVRALSIQDKMALISLYRLPIIPPMLLGLAESYVLAEAPLVYPEVFVVCRRMRLALGLDSERMDSDNEPYDYDTTVIYTAHIFDRTQDQDSVLPDAISALPGVTLSRPMDCVIAHQHLFVADGGDGDRLSAVHVWSVTPPTDAASNPVEQTLYG